MLLHRHIMCGGQVSNWLQGLKSLQLHDHIHQSCTGSRMSTRLHASALQLSHAHSSTTV